MPAFLFASDLHGRIERYATLLATITQERPQAVFLGGDLLPSGHFSTWPGSTDDFFTNYFFPEFRRLRVTIGQAPRIFLIPGNDDPQRFEQHFQLGETDGLWEYAHGRRIDCDPYTVYGYACVPPTPFRFKDWERYDIDHSVDPGCISPEEGERTIPMPANEIRDRTIARELDSLTGSNDLSQAIFLFHTPPYRTQLDRASLGADAADLIPIDVHVGSIAVSRFIRRRQPLLTLHGHVHESARITGEWKDRIDRTVCLSAAHDGPELAIIRFDPETPDEAVRELR